MALSGAKAMAGMLEYALGLPEAHEDHPWGEVVAKVRGKVFVFFGTEKTRADGVFLCVKLPDSGPMLHGQDWAKPAGYGLGKSGWVELRLPRGDIPPLSVLREWIEESYRAVAPKACVRRLDGEAPERSSSKATGKAARKSPRKATPRKKSPQKKVARRGTTRKIQDREPPRAR